LSSPREGEKSDKSDKRFFCVGASKEDGLTRLTNAFSKKAANHAHMMAIYFMHYNFVRIPQTLKVTPAMAAGVTSKLWEKSVIVGIVEDWEAAKAEE
jgi:hypothetical protein